MSAQLYQGAIDAATAIGPILREHEAAIDGARQLPEPVLDALHDAGLFCLSLSPSFGGAGSDPITMARAVEEVARANGSAGWCVMIANQVAAFISAYMPEQCGRDIYGDNARAVNAWGVAPTGKATPVEGGYIVSGRWPFASGCMHSQWLHGRCRIEDGETSAPAGGNPTVLAFSVPRSAAQVIDTWDVTGMRGTGSHDFAVQEVFVPTYRTVPYTFGATPRNPAPPYRLFVMHFMAQATLMLGIAARALDEFLELSSRKTPRSASTVLREQPTVQRDFGQAWASVGSARAYLYEAASAAYEAALSADDVPLKLRAELRLAMNHASHSSIEAVNLMHDAAGASAIWSSSGIERCFRDIHTAKAHITVGPAAHLDAAKVLLGLEPGPGFA